MGNKIRLLKFRSLISEYDLDKIKPIIEKNQFWVSKLWNQNDPLEGIYSSVLKDKVKEIFNQKNEVKICSFSSINALHDPLLWGYYSSGYKGIAIEIEVDEDDVSKIDYQYKKELKTVFSEVAIEKIVSRKLKKWKHEKEYRYFIKRFDDGLQEIGKVKKIYFGEPYFGLGNSEDVINNSSNYQKYEKLRNVLISVCNDVNEKRRRKGENKIEIIFYNPRY